MSSQKLSVDNEEVDLGVLIQDNLKVNKHCASKVSTANRCLGMIKRNFVNKSKSIIIPLYKSLVRPHLDYCSVVWRPHLEKDKQLIEKVQHRATKLISNIKTLPYN